jgi:hypothetical protein
VGVGGLFERMRWKLNYDFYDEVRRECCKLMMMMMMMMVCGGGKDIDYNRKLHEAAARQEEREQKS